MADFPNVQESDSDDVRWALETAHTMWNQGDKQEALKWLRRAAESAEQSGDDMRSLMLAKARAELHSLVEHDETAPTPLASPVSISTPMPPPSTPPAAARASSRPASPSGAPPHIASPSSPPTGHTASRPPSRPAPPPKRVSGPGGTPSTRTPLGGPPPSGRGDEESRQTLINPNRAPLPQPSMTRGPMDERRAIRVAVQPVEGQPGVFLTRPLRPGERPAPGASEAILVSIESGADPLGR